MHYVRGAVFPPPPHPPRGPSVTLHQFALLSQSQSSQRPLIYREDSRVLFFFSVLILLRRRRQACPSRHEDLTTVVDVDGGFLHEAHLRDRKSTEVTRGALLPSFNASLSLTLHPFPRVTQMTSGRAGDVVPLWRFFKGTCVYSSRCDCRARADLHSCISILKADINLSVLQMPSA